MRLVLNIENELEVEIGQLAQKKLPVPCKADKRFSHGGPPYATHKSNGYLHLLETMFRRSPLFFWATRRAFQRPTGKARVRGNSVVRAKEAFVGHVSGLLTDPALHPVLNTVPAFRDTVHFFF